LSISGYRIRLRKSECHSYLNQYVKLYFDWQHAEFGQPVSHGPNGFARTSNLYWVRFQLYF
jgi:phosphate-selective porin OprO and OprP